MSAAARVRAARNTIVAAWECGRSALGDPATEAAQALEDRGLLQSPETAAALKRLRSKVAELEQVETALRALLPTEPRRERGLPNDLSHEAGWYGAMEMVAEVLGVSLPYVMPLDDEPVPYVPTERAEAELLPSAAVTSAAMAAVAKLRRTLALPGGERP
ncbi:hypothetical protein [Streptomyces coffeae]|uniref:Uncharacterized protein n=1 Tax=Streptomyces coffeae TaxID=621382 RepID=A0ABS1NJB8_9ACTN|nr:hypothetical protein [Streptomyces coffeae]MBL1100093.1 hypothetical protein [Streptomyces coffeae]